MTTSAQHIRDTYSREWLKRLRDPQTRYRDNAARLISYGEPWAEKGRDLNAALDRINEVFPPRSELNPSNKGLWQ